MPTPRSLPAVVVACLPLLGVVSCAASTPTSEPLARTRNVAEPRWQEAVAREARALSEHWPGSTVRIAVVDVASGETLASAGPVEESHPTGSTIKPFTLAAAYRRGVSPDDRIDGTAVMVGAGDDAARIEDAHPVPKMNAEGVVIRSSNVGVTRLALELGPRALYDDLVALTGLPSAASDDERQLLRHLFGGDSEMSTAQLARTYAMLANDGVDPVSGASRIEPHIARAVHHALEQAVVAADGTAGEAAVRGLRVGGKTGTATGPAPGRHTVLFVGIGPLPDPVWVVAVVVEDVDADAYGGSVAAPAFSRVVREALGLTEGSSAMCAGPDPHDCPV